MLVEVLDVNVSTEQCRSRGRRRFHFEAAWAADVECQNLVCDSWGNHNSGGTMQQVVKKIQSCATKLDKWNSKNRWQLKKGIEGKRKELSNSLQRPDLNSWMSIRVSELLKTSLIGC